MSAARSLTAMARPQHRLVLWLALLLALFGALAPTVSHALNWARGGNAGLMEVCTSNGPRWMALGSVQADTTLPGAANSLEADGSGDPASAVVFVHCPFCLLSAERAAPPPQAGFYLPMVIGTATAPEGWQASFISVSLALMPPPRGPPHLS